MSNTIAHRPHVHHRHVPMLPVLAVIIAVIIATAVIWAVNQPETAIVSTGGEAITMPAAQPGVVPAPESPVFRHAMTRVRLTGAEWQAYKYGRLHQVDGATLDPVSPAPFSARNYEAPGYQR